MRGKWRIVEMPGYDASITEAAYILFHETGGEFAFSGVTGTIYGSCEGDTVEFIWDGNDEMDPTSGDGWVELQDDGSLEGEICFHNGDEATFIARPTTTSSTAC